MSNNIVFIGYLFVETIGLALIINFSLIGRLLHTLVYSLLGLFILYCFIRLLQLGFQASFFHEFRLVASVLLIMVAGISMIQQSSNTQVFILSNPMFVLSFAVLLYFSVSLFIFGALDLILDNSLRLVSSPIWNVHSIINIFTNVLYAICLWLSYRQKRLFL